MRPSRLDLFLSDYTELQMLCTDGRSLTGVHKLYLVLRCGCTVNLYQQREGRLFSNRSPNPLVVLCMHFEGFFNAQQTAGFLAGLREEEIERWDHH